MSPLTIQIMLACHCSPQPQQWFPDAQWKSKPAEQARRFLIEQELIEQDTDLGGSFRATAKGSAWADFICDTPLPRVKWVLSRDRDERQDQPSK